jgi:hypothetical protein
VIDQPVVKVVGAMKAGATIENVTVMARVGSETLTFDSGIALLNDNVREARDSLLQGRPDDP